MEKKIDYLIAVPSSCQMYSGTGRIIMDWIQYALNDINFSLMMDSHIIDNYIIAKEFCEKHNIQFIESQPNIKPGMPDSGLKELIGHSKRYDIVEVYSWANASTNEDVIDYCKRVNFKGLLCFTPFGQPIETLYNNEKYYYTEKMFRRIATEADCIFLLSRTESNLPALKPHKNKSHLVHGAVDSKKLFIDLNKKRNERSILVVCDCNERRKRVSLILSSFEILIEKNSGFELIICGKNSEDLKISESIAKNVTLKGYVSEDALINLYQTCGLFLSLSEYEAFCLPIAEALSCGLPVLISNDSIMHELFDNIHGVNFTNGDGPLEVANNIINALNVRFDNNRISKEAANAFDINSVYEKKLNILRSGLTLKERSNNKDVNILNFTPKFFSTQSVVGGGEKHVDYITKAIKLSKNYNILSDVIALSDRTESCIGKYGKFIKTDVLGDHHYQTERFGELYELIDAYDIIIVHQCFSMPSLIFASLSKLKGKYVIGLDQGGGECLFVRNNPKISLTYDLLIPYSKYGELTLLEYGPKTKLIKGPVDNLFFRPFRNKKNSDANYILSVGRILPHKGYENIINAMPVNCRLVIVGQPYNLQYYNYLVSLAIEKKVDLEIVCDASDFEIRKLMNNCLAYVHSSVHIDIYGTIYQKPELLGLAPLEALSCGKLVFVSNSGSLDELSDVTGCTVYNTVTELKGMLNNIRHYEYNVDDVIMSVSKNYGLSEFSEKFDLIIDEWMIVK